MELQCQQQENLEYDHRKSTLTAEDLLAQQQFARSIPIIERDQRPSATKPDQNQ